MTKAYNSLNKNPANYIHLTPISFLSRTADIFGERDAIIYGEKVFSWNQCLERCLRMASSLSKKGIREGDTVAVLAFNTTEMFEAHFSIPMTGGILNTINTRLDYETIAYILDFGQVKGLFVDRELLPIVQKALQNQRL